MVVRRASSTAVRAQRIGTRKSSPEAKGKADRVGQLVPSEVPMKVQSRTLGTIMDFNLLTDNLSKTGLLLSQGNYKLVPFDVNTLIEMTIDPDGALLAEPVQCLGKIVRKTTAGDNRPAFGVHIIQFENQDESQWQIAVQGLERQAGSDDPSGNHSDEGDEGDAGATVAALVAAEEADAPINEMPLAS